MNNTIVIIALLFLINFSLNFKKIHNNDKTILQNLNENKTILIYSSLIVILSSSLLFI
jgi:hypothetical protein